MSDTKCISWSGFADKEGRPYTLEVGSALHEITLEQATKLDATTRPGGSFRLAFRGPYEPLLPQGIYRVRAEDFDDDIFLVPVTREESGTLYEAIFN